MKKLRLKIGIAALLLGVWGASCIQSYAAEEVLDVKDVYHKHTGDSTNGGGCYSVAIYHTHIGDPTNGSGCYTKKSQTAISEYKNCLYNTEGWEGNYYNAYIKCSGCSYVCHYYQSYKDSSGNVIVTKNTSAKDSCMHYITTTQTVYELNCGKTLETVENWAMGCGSEETVIGKISFYKTVNENQYILKVISDASININNISWSTGNNSDSIMVTSDGTYSCTVSYSESNRSDTAIFTYTVSDYPDMPVSSNNVKNEELIISGHTETPSGKEEGDMEYDAKDNEEYYGAESEEEYIEETDENICDEEFMEEEPYVVPVTEENIYFDIESITEPKVPLKNMAEFAVVGTTSTIALTFGVMFIFGLGIGNVKVYGIDTKGRRIFLCNAMLKKGKLKIPQYRLKRNKTNSIIIKCNLRIVKKHSGELISIQIGDKTVSRPLQKEIQITY